MDQDSLVNQLIECLDHHKVIKLQIEWLDGKKEDILFEPYLIGEDLVSNWIFIYGKDDKKNHVIFYPVPFILSIEDTDDIFTLAEKDKTFLITDNMKKKIIKSIPEIHVIDMSEPEDEEDDDEVHTCPFCGVDYNCQHLVFEYDLSFNEFKAGRLEELNEVRNVIRDVFLDAITKKKALDFTADYSENWFGYGKYFEELWGSTKANYEPKDGSVVIDDDVFMRLIKYMYIEFATCYDLYKKTYSEGDYAPGFDSAMLGYYAKDPSQILKSTAIVLKEYLEAIRKKGRNK